MNNSMNISQKTRKMTLSAILAAIVVILQVFTTFVKFGPINPSLVLVPVVLSAVIIGYKGAALMGAVFGLVVFVLCVTASDPGGYMMFAASPILTFILCMVKGTLAGLIPGVVYKYCKISKKNQALNLILPAALAPVINTGIFCAGLWLFYSDILAVWAGGTNTLTYMFTGLIGLNFIFEFALNVIICPIIASRLKKI